MTLSTAILFIIRRIIPGMGCGRRSRCLCLLSLALLSLLLLAPPLVSLTHAQPTDEELLSINMRDAEIGAVIQWIGEKTRKQIVVDPRVKGTVTVLANEPMSLDQAYQVFLATLDVYGFSAVESGGILRIAPATLAKTSPAAIVENYRDLSGGEQIVYVYRAKNVSAARLGQLLQPLIASSGFVSTFADSNSLVLSDDAANIRRLVDLAQQIDSSGSFDLRIIPLQHAAADQVAGVVSSLVGNTSGETGFAVAADARSNSVLMSGDPATRQRVEQLIAQLDQPIATSGTTRVVYLHYLEAKEVLPILQGISGAVKEGDKNVSSAQTPISIEISESANAVIMTAPPNMLDLMESVIKDVDIRRSQVLVEAIIVEISSDFSKTLGVEWNTNLALDDNVETLTNFGLRGDIDTTTDINSVSSLLGSGLSLGFYRNGSLRALVRAIANESDANILSTPSILTLDNQEAEILVGSNVPFITGQVTGTSSTTTNPFTTIERQDIGLTLKITPKISQGNAVTLDVLQEIESIAESSDVASDIVTNKRSIKTKVLVDDNTILVLGGLISDEKQVVENKVPFLGDVPLIGQLFKSNTERLVKKNLMVFIHPVIIAAPGDSEDATRAKYDHMKTLRERFNSGGDIDSSMLKDFDTYLPQGSLPKESLPQENRLQADPAENNGATTSSPPH